MWSPKVLLVTAAALLCTFDDVRAQNITSDTVFYGESPPVYPSPQGTGAGDWTAAYIQARAFVAQLTNEEKWNLTAGMSANNSCSGNINAIPRLGFPGLCLSDAGNGLRGTDFVDAYPAGLHVGASWNKSHAAERGLEMGLEFRRKGVNIALGPVVGPLGRIAEAGRNWEGFSNDPYLCGSLVYEHVTGFQSTGAQACTKHYILNEQETNRNPSTNAQDESVASVSSNLDDLTIHELYSWPFAEAVRANTGSIMCSYNRINNSYACQNSKTMNGILKTELGFQGFVMTDWFAQHAGVAAALAGLDMSMPSYPFGYGNLTAQNNNGSVPQSRLDDQATRIIASWYFLGQESGYPAPGLGMPRSYFAPHPQVSGKSASSKSVLYTGAQEGHVLVKNLNNALPLKNPKLLSLFGYAANANYSVNLSGVSFGNVQPPQSVPGLQWVGGGSGANNPAFVSDYVCAFGDRAYQYDTSILWDFTNVNPNVDAASDACIVAINAYATEGWDRRGLHDDYSDSIILNVASKCNNTMVVIQNAGIRLVDTFYNHPNITAIVYAHLPGQDAGRALASLFYGDTSFSGKLPYTVAKNESDYGALLAPSQPEGIDWLFPQSNFTEGVYIDYRAFDAQNITPRFEFGFGLTYSTFTFTNLTASIVPNTTLTPYPSPAPIIPGGNPNLFTALFTVSITLTNTGTFTAAEVAQLYLGIPGAPIRQLRGFEKVLLAPGTAAQVTFALTRKDLSRWDTVAQEWLLQTGTYEVYVGSSSRDLPLRATLVISGANGNGGSGGGGSSTMSTVTKTSSTTTSAAPSNVTRLPWPTASWSCGSNGGAGWGWGQGGSGVTGGEALRVGSGWGKGW